MALALSLGRRGLGRTWPNPAVGAVIVKDGVIVGRGWTQPGGRPHAEVEALRRAGPAARGATLYVTLEPCSHLGKSPPCADAVIAAGISRVVSAIEDPNPEVAGAGPCAAASSRYCSRHRRRRRRGPSRSCRPYQPHDPWPSSRDAQARDLGRRQSGAAGRRPIAITGEAVRDRVHLLRAQNDAIMIGIGTALADDPMLTCRLPGMAKDSPVRIVADSMLRLPLNSRLVKSAYETPVWAIAGMSAPQDAEFRLLPLGVEVLRSPDSTDPLDLEDALGVSGGEGDHQTDGRRRPDAGRGHDRGRSRRRGRAVSFATRSSAPTGSRRLMRSGLGDAQTTAEVDRDRACRAGSARDL